MSDYSEIGFFYLEELTLNDVPFYFFDISMTHTQVVDEPLRTILKSTVELELNDVEPYLKEKVEELATPIVLLCEDGVRSKKLAFRLSQLGFGNVNVVEGGLQGLTLETNALTHS